MTEVHDLACWLAEPSQARFVAVEGPKGSGKTALCTALAGSFSYRLVVTKEPTPAFDLSQEQRLGGAALASAIADDRRRHLDEVIEPALACGQHVVCDRYILSSLVFHTLDGVPRHHVWALNQSFRLPDVNAVVVVSVDTLLTRRASRGTSTRLQAEADPAIESAAYVEEARRLESVGCATRTIDNDHGEPYAVAQLAALLEHAT
jgi:dTMP kinase